MLILLFFRASPPVLDHQGLWVDLDLNYESNFCVSLVTHVNFLKMVLKKGDSDNHGPTSSNFRRSDSPPANYHEPSSPTSDRSGVRQSHIYDSDADDSGESSEDEHDNELNNIITVNAPDSTVDPNQSKSAKFLEKLANSSLMNRGLVKKIVNNVAATPIVLAVELK